MGHNTRTKTQVLGERENGKVESARGEHFLHDGHTWTPPRAGVWGVQKSVGFREDTRHAKGTCAAPTHEKTIAAQRPSKKRGRSKEEELGAAGGGERLMYEWTDHSKGQGGVRLRNVLIVVEKAKFKTSLASGSKPSWD